MNARKTGEGAGRSYRLNEQTFQYRVTLTTHIIFNNIPADEKGDQTQHDEIECL